MSIVLDEDVVSAAKLLQSQFPAAKLVSISEAVAALAPVIWGRYPREEVAPPSFIFSPEQTPTDSK